jgi:hypothetical protein
LRQTSAHCWKHSPKKPASVAHEPSLSTRTLRKRNHYPDGALGRSPRSSTVSSEAFVSCESRDLPRARGTARRSLSIPPFMVFPGVILGPWTRKKGAKSRFGA